MKTIEEQIKVMQHFANGGLIEFADSGKSYWTSVKEPVWDWVCFDYRIKEEKKTITIEKWLCKNSLGFAVIDCDEKYLSSVGWEKIKLIETYEVEL
jgi:hypothetical protein